MPATPIWSLNFKRAWQAQSLSHTSETLEKYVSYIDLLILVPFFEIHDGVWDKNFVHRCHIHILSHPWVDINHSSQTISNPSAFKLLENSKIAKLSRSLLHGYSNKSFDMTNSIVAFSNENYKKSITHTKRKIWCFVN